MICPVYRDNLKRYDCLDRLSEKLWNRLFICKNIKYFYCSCFHTQNCSLFENIDFLHFSIINGRLILMSHSDTCSKWKPTVSKLLI